MWSLYEDVSSSVEAEGLLQGPDLSTIKCQKGTHSFGSKQSLGSHSKAALHILDSL